MAKLGQDGNTSQLSNAQETGFSCQLITMQ